MLYGTHHHPFVFSFNPLSHSSSPFPPNLLYSSPSLQGMKCGKGALRSCFGPEMAVKTTPQGGFMDDFLVVNAGGSGDDFFVDDLLDFSNNGFSETEEQQQEEAQKHETCFLPASGQHMVNDDSSVKHDFDSIPCSELSVPADDLENLEWLSHFVEDSFAEYSLTTKSPPNPTENRSEQQIPVPEKPCFTTPVQTKARTKRTRAGVRVWPLGSSSFTESSSSSSSSTSPATSFSATNPYLFYASPFQSQTAESWLGKPPLKKQKKKPTEFSGGGAPRRCSHCGVTKTPQWRAGPLGAKTLCNACGVRYKSGRLLPEYRPACSPTFSTELHSNNHRKVLEMRHKKEAEATGLAPPVPSF